MLHAGIEALFGRSRDHHRKRHLFSLLRRHNNHKDEDDEVSNLFSDKAHTEKDILQGENFGFAAMQGWRSTMEDKHKHLTSFDERSWKLWSYFSIFDGHNGNLTRSLCAFIFQFEFVFSKVLTQRNTLLINLINTY